MGGLCLKQNKQDSDNPMRYVGIVLNHNSGLMIKIRIFITLLGVVFVSFISSSQSDVIYGTDTRQNISDLKSERLKKLSEASAAMVYTKKLVSVGRLRFQVHGPSYQSKNKLCAEERFFDEPVVADCSGFLVSPNIIVTAGHCLKRETDCKKISWVFGLNDQAIVNSRSVEFDRSNVYSCQSVLKFDPEVLDIAVLQLDRKVTKRTPLRYRDSSTLTKSDPLAVIGNSGQLVTKIATNGRVTEENDDSFLAEVSSCYGSSGSAVVNARTGLLEGVLVNGETDWVWDARAKCNRSKVCKRGECSGETVIRIQEALKGVVF